MQRPTDDQIRMMKRKLKDVIYNILICDLGLKNVGDLDERSSEVLMLHLLREATKLSQKDSNE